MSDVRRLPLEALVIDEDQPRRSLDEVDLARLQESLAAHGLIQPIVVTPEPGAAGRFRIVAGWRRAEAALRLGWADVDAVVVEAGSPATTHMAQAAENTARAGLRPAELLEVVRRASAEGRSSQDIAAGLGVSDRLVRYYMAVLRHPDLAGALAAGASLRRSVAEAKARESGASAIPSPTPAPAPTDRSARARRRARAAVEAIEANWHALEPAQRAELADRLARITAPGPEAVPATARAPTGSGEEPPDRSDP